MSTSAAYAHLLAPGRIGPMETRNRIVMSPMGTNLAEEDGRAGERLQRYYEARARGGAGLIVVGVGAIAYPAGACIPRQVAISDDTFLPGLRALTDRAHAHGARIAIQLQHAGKVATQDMAAGRPVWVPSVPSLSAGDVLNDLTQDEIDGVIGHLMKPGAKLGFHEMTVAEIGAVVERFAEAADRARRAGFDGVEIHAAHGYLLAGFLSPASNHRTDEYGGRLENRARLLVEVLRAVRRRVGDDFAVWCRLDAREFRIDNGITPEDAQRHAELAEAAGADAVHVSAYGDPTSGVAFTDAPLVHTPCGYLPLAAAIKRRLRIPVIAVGRIEPAEADGAIAGGQADFVAMARKLLADPELPNKLRDGRADEIRPCIYCYTCVGNIFLNRSVSCASNPATGREAEFEIVPAAAAKRVLIAGGGPAGMEAARVAALRGHSVVLCEKSDRLGGTAWFAALVYEANGRLVEHLESQVLGLGVDVRRGQPLTAELVREVRPDAILLATGARRQPPAIPGADRANVFAGDDLRALLTGTEDGATRHKLSLAQRALLGAGRLLGVTDRLAQVRELSRRWMPLGKRVVIVGGGLVGLELAEFLCERGRTLTVLEPDRTFAVEMALPRRWRVLHSLREHGVEMLNEVVVCEIGKGEVVCEHRGERRAVAADAVVLAVGTEPDRGVAELVAGLVAEGIRLEVHSIGDCREVGYLEGALLDAARVARAL